MIVIITLTVLILMVAGNANVQQDIKTLMMSKKSEQLWLNIEKLITLMCVRVAAVVQDFCNFQLPEKSLFQY